MHNTNISCGCLIEYEGDQTHQDYSIHWCPLHAAAGDMRDAILWVYQDAAYKLPEELNPVVVGQWLDRLHTAYAKATGGQHATTD